MVIDEARAAFPQFDILADRNVAENTQGSRHNYKEVLQEEFL